SVQGLGLGQEHEIPQILPQAVKWQLITAEIIVNRNPPKPKSGLDGAPSRELMSRVWDLATPKLQSRFLAALEMTKLFGELIALLKAGLEQNNRQLAIFAHPVAKNATRMGQPAIDRQWPLLISLTMLVTKAFASPKSMSVRSR